MFKASLSLLSFQLGSSLSFPSSSIFFSPKPAQLPFQAAPTTTLPVSSHCRRQEGPACQGHPLPRARRGLTSRCVSQAKWEQLCGISRHGAWWEWGLQPAAWPHWPMRRWCSEDLPGSSEDPGKPEAGTPNARCRSRSAKGPRWHLAPDDRSEGTAERR